MSDICESTSPIPLIIISYAGDHRESAATLEAESGYIMEAPEVSEFRHHILDGFWTKAEAALQRLGVTDEEGLWVHVLPNFYVLTPANQ